MFCVRATYTSKGFVWVFRRFQGSSSQGFQKIIEDITRSYIYAYAPENDDQTIKMVCVSGLSCHTSDRKQLRICFRTAAITKIIWHIN